MLARTLLFRLVVLGRDCRVRERDENLVYGHARRVDEGEEGWVMSNNFDTTGQEKLVFVEGRLNARHESRVEEGVGAGGEIRLTVFSARPIRSLPSSERIKNLVSSPSHFANRAFMMPTLRP